MTAVPLACLLAAASGASPLAVVLFAIFVLGTLGLSFWLGRKASDSAGYFAAHGQIPWWVNGVAFAGDYLSAASFLGICGMIAFYGYDGFLYSIGFLAGWIVALFVIAEPMKRLGKFTFADALDAKFVARGENTRGIKLAAGLSTLVVSVFYLIPQMVGAGVLVQPLLDLPHWAGVVIVGVTVVLIVVFAGMVSTTWVQFIKGGLLVAFSLLTVVLLLREGLVSGEFDRPSQMAQPSVAVRTGSSPPSGIFARGELETGEVEITRDDGDGRIERSMVELTVPTTTFFDGDDPGSGPLGPVEYLQRFAASDIVLPDANAEPGTRFETVRGRELLSPGRHPKFAGIRGDVFSEKIDFLSLMLALFCGTASLPHILIRYYTVKDAAAARKSTVVGIATIGFFYILTLYMGLGALVRGAVDPGSSNLSAPLLARSLSEPLFAAISAIAFTTVLGTVSGLILASAGAIAHDIAKHGFGRDLDDDAQVRLAKTASIVVGVIAIVLGILFKDLNVGYLVGWAFAIAASANLPSLIMLLFWPKTTRQGIVAAVLVGMTTSLGWILLSGDTFKSVYGLDPATSPMPFSQPGIVTIPLGFATLVVVSLLTQPKPATQPNPEG